MSENKVYKKILRCVESIRKKTDFKPEIALVLGSGFGEYASIFEQACEISYTEIEGFPVSTAPGHAGKYLFGYLEGAPVVIMNGRVHYYEGYDISDVVLPIRIMKLLGAEVLFLTNAAGGINSGFKPGDLMMIKDHISTFVPSPIRGENIDELGLRFPDMSSVYNKELQEILKSSAKEEGVELKEGIYAQTPGPQYETPAEVQMLKVLGADAVGMSTACEAIAGNHMGMKVCGFSCVSNMAAGISKNPLTAEEVFETTKLSSKNINALIRASIKNIHAKI